MSLTKTLMIEEKIRAKKRMGQNFLINTQALETIIETAELKKTDCVFEIGSGTGNLSELIALHPEQFHTIEKDLSFKKILNKKLSCFKNTNIFFGDILKFDLKKIFSGKRIKIIGNLPYYITSPILLYLLDQKEYIENIVITVQKEVAERIVAPPGNKDYGRLSCLLQYYTNAQLIDIFPRHFFMPKPEVDSALIKLQILKKPSITVNDEKIFFKIVKAIFAQRRKTLLNGLSNAGWDIKKNEIAMILSKVNISPSIRGEMLSLTEIGSISDAIGNSI